MISFSLYQRSPMSLLDRYDPDLAFIEKGVLTIISVTLGLSIIYLFPALPEKHWLPLTMAIVIQAATGHSRIQQLLNLLIACTGAITITFTTHMAGGSHWAEPLLLAVFSFIYMLIGIKNSPWLYISLVWLIFVFITQAIVTNNLIVPQLKMQLLGSGLAFLIILIKPNLHQWRIKHLRTTFFHALAVHNQLLASLYQYGLRSTQNEFAFFQQRAWLGDILTLLEAQIQQHEKIKHSNNIVTLESYGLHKLQHLRTLQTNLSSCRFTLLDGSLQPHLRNQLVLLFNQLTVWLWEHRCCNDCNIILLQLEKLKHSSDEIDALEERKRKALSNLFSYLYDLVRETHWLNRNLTQLNLA